MGKRSRCDFHTFIDFVIKCGMNLQENHNKINNQTRTEFKIYCRPLIAAPGMRNQAFKSSVIQQIYWDFYCCF
jgi:hypothetical protein